MRMDVFLLLGPSGMQSSFVYIIVGYLAEVGGAG